MAATLTLAAAADPGERLTDPAREARARAIFRETRCLVCQGESIDESDAPLAADLRRAIRELIGAGASSDEVRAFLIRRYGDFVLFRPRFDGINLLLWLTPFAVALAGVGLLAFRRSGTVPPLTEEEARRLAALAPGDGP
jgi:cytochrome c-type biogenesis protein CcmH